MANRKIIVAYTTEEQAAMRIMGDPLPATHKELYFLTPSRTQRIAEADRTPDDHARLQAAEFKRAVRQCKRLK